MYKLKAVSTSNGVHLVNPEKMPKSLFLNVLNQLKKEFTYNLDFNTYPDQPVYQFKTAPDKVITFINNIFENITAELS